MLFPTHIRAEDLPAGTVLRRHYRGYVHEVHVLDNCTHPGRALTPAEKRRRRWRYLYCGERYRSLTAICSTITGWRCYSGEKFFGLAPLGRRDEPRADLAEIRAAGLDARGDRG